MEASREWLDQFQAEHRGAIANHFYEVVRRYRGQVEAARGCSEVFRKLVRQQQQNEWERQGGVNRLEVIEAMERDPDGAKRFMLWVMDQERKPREERVREKETAEQEGKRRYMEGQPPTEKQLAVLERLGIDEIPENRWRASELIEEFKTW